MIGLVGAQRVGKTTLAKAFEQVSGLVYVDASVRDLAKSVGLDTRSDMPLEHRLKCQELMLSAYADLMRAESRRLKGLFICDRTPIDFATYMLCDVTWGTDQALAPKINAYVDKAMQLTAELFSMVVLVQPGIPLTECATSAPANEAYMRHFNSTALGLICGDDFLPAKFAIPVTTTGLEERVSFVRRAAQGCRARHEQEFLATRSYLQ